MRDAHEAQFRSFDGGSLFYRHWPAVDEGPRRAVVLLHRGHEHSALSAAAGTDDNVACDGGRTHAAFVESLIVLP